MDEQKEFKVSWFQSDKPTPDEVNSVITNLLGSFHLVGYQTTSLRDTLEGMREYITPDQVASVIELPYGFAMVQDPYAWHWLKCYAEGREFEGISGRGGFRPFDPNDPDHAQMREYAKTLEAELGLDLPNK